MELWILHFNLLRLVHIVCHPSNLNFSLNTILPNRLKRDIEIAKATQHFSAFE